MSERETAREIEEAALRWVARIDGTPNRQADLDTWLGGDGRRRGAYFRAMAAWRSLDRARSIGALPLPGASESILEDADRVIDPRRRTFIIGGSLLAGSVAAGGVFLLLAPKSMQIDTAIGEIRRVPLADGSMAEINTRTKVAIELRPQIRQIRLSQGEAWFQVAHDKQRPFVVEAGDIRVRAVGTAFSVRRDEDLATVQVTEGTVEIWRAGDEEHKTRMSAGSRAVIDQGPNSDVALIEQAGLEIDRKLAWRAGQIVLNGDTLEEAVVEFNRYNQIRVRIGDPQLAGERLVGRFRTNEPQAFARAVATMLNASAVETNREIVISRSYPKI
jgi:transmembrane sensor